VAVVLLILGVTTHKLTPLKSVLMDISSPLYYLSDMPTAIARWFNRVITPNSSLRFENNQLKAEALVLKGKLQQLNALSMENIDCVSY
jgi:cell shape-determining protein MreC